MWGGTEGRSCIAGVTWGHELLWEGVSSKLKCRSRKLAGGKPISAELLM